MIRTKVVYIFLIIFALYINVGVAASAPTVIPITGNMQYVSNTPVSVCSQTVVTGNTQTLTFVQLNTLIKNTITIQGTLSTTTQCPTLITFTAPTVTSNSIFLFTFIGTLRPMTVNNSPFVISVLASS